MTFSHGHLNFKNKFVWSFAISLLLHAALGLAWLTKFSLVHSAKSLGSPAEAIELNFVYSSGAVSPGISRPEVLSETVSILPKLENLKSSRIQSASSLTNRDLRPGDSGLRVTYPRLSRILREEGRVVIQVTSIGGLRKISVLVSSGYERLDESALIATDDALQNGKLASFFTEDRAEIPYVFRLAEK